MLFRSVSLLGCTASPHVSYVKVTPDNAWDHLDHLKFSLASTLVKIDCGTEQQPKPDQADETAPANNANQTNPSRKNNPTDDPASNTNGCPNGLKLLATVVPVDSATIYAMVPRYVWFMRTDLSATYVDESRVAQKVGVEVQDDRVTIVKTVAAIAGVAIAKVPVMGVLTKGLAPPPVMAPKVPEKLPVVIDFEEYKMAWNNRNVIIDPNAPDNVYNNVDIGPKFPLPQNPGWKYWIELPPLATDAVSTKAFFAKPDLEVTRAFPYSACRKAKLNLGYGSAATPTHSFSLVIHDPEYIQAVPLPPKGAVEKKAGCGVNVTSSGATVNTGWDVLSQVVTEVKGLLENQKEEEKKGEKPKE